MRRAKLIITKEDWEDTFNNIVAAQGCLKRIIVWESRLMRELKRLEKYMLVMRDGE